MRLVEDDRVRRRQQLGHAGVAQHYIGEEQMVIHHDDVRLVDLLLAFPGDVDAGDRAA